MHLKHKYLNTINTSNFNSPNKHLFWKIVLGCWHLSDINIWWTCGLRLIQCFWVLILECLGTSWAQLHMIWIMLQVFEMKCSKSFQQVLAPRITSWWCGLTPGKTANLRAMEKLLKIAKLFHTHSRLRVQNQ